MIKQLAIFIENQKGSLRRVTASLHEAGISIFAFSTIDSPEFGILRMIVTDPERAEQVLTQKGFVAKTCEVIAVRLHEQKEMDKLLEAIDSGNININYTYSSFGSDSNTSVMILNCTDPDETEEMMMGQGFCCLSRVDA